MTPNEIVAWNLSRARTLRDWTQAEAAERLSRHLARPISEASYAQSERVSETRRRRFDADDLMAFARAFDLNVAYFLLPPSPGTPGHEREGLAAMDAILWLNADTRAYVLQHVAMTAGGSELLRRWADDHAALVSEREAAIETLLAARDALHEPMLVATESFTTDYDGEQVDIVAGRTRVVPDHPIAREHADKFRPDDFDLRSKP